ncbi:MAG: hypothetical protein ACUVXJ_11165 [Phycisphaerae bacterium]
MRITPLLLAGCFLALLMAGPIWADDVLPPDWRGNYGTIMAE